MWGIDGPSLLYLHIGTDTLGACWGYIKSFKNRKMNKTEKQLVQDTCRNTSIALQMFSKGTIWIEISKKGVRMTGDKKGQELISNALSDPKKMIEVLDYFGWSYTKVGKNITGEGIIAYTFFSIMMGGIDDIKLTKDFFNHLSLGFK